MAATALAPNADRARWRYGWPKSVGLAVGVGLLVRIADVLATRHMRPVSDSWGYLLRGSYLQAHLRLWPITHHGGTFPDAYWPPFFPATLALIIELRSILLHLIPGAFVGLIAWTRLAMSVVGCATVAGVALICDRLFGRRVAVTAAWITALFPPMIDLGGSLYSESLLVPLMIGATAATVEYRRTRRRALVPLAGVLTGLAALTHSDGIVLLLPLGAALWPSHRVSARGLMPLAVLVLSAALMITPWTIRNAVVFHAFVPLSLSLGNTMAGTYNARSASTSPPAIWRKPNRLPDFRAIFRAHPVNTPAQDAALRDQAIHYLGRKISYLPTVVLFNTLHLLQFTEFRQSKAFVRRERSPLWTLYVADVSLWLLCLVGLAGCLTRAARPDGSG